MRIGILGTGNVGRTLAAGLAGVGHEVRIGSRDPDRPELRAWLADRTVTAGTLEDAAGFGDVLILATLWTGTHNALRLAGQDAIADKVLIDATNPLASSGNAPPSLAIGGDDSGGEQVQRWVPRARVVKAFNTVGYALMVQPDLPDGPPDMFLCGNDAEAKETVTAICRELGWPTIDMGGIEASRVLEPLCLLWLRYGALTGTWRHAFRLLRG